MKRSELAKAIYQLAHLDGEFVLSSGVKTDEYFDKYKFESTPGVLGEIAKHMAKVLPHDTEVLAAMEMGGIPLVTAVSLETGLPFALVRKQVKFYATSSQVEGTSVDGRQICLLEDIITTGKQTLEGYKILVEHGATVPSTVCILLREESARENFENAGVDLQPLFTIDALRSYQ